MADSSYIFGRNAVIEALNADKGIEKIMIAFGAQGAVMAKIYKMAKQKNVPCVVYDKNKFQALERTAMGDAGFSNSQGVIALTRSFELYSLDRMIDEADMSANPVIVVLDEISDPHNLGAIARSAECAGAIGIIVTERNSAPITPAAIKASAGALEHIPIAKVSNLAHTLDLLKEKGFWIVGSDGKGDRQYTDNIYDSPIALVIGSEGKGMRPSVVKHCDFLVRIPMMGGVNSLNASVSSGVLLFEIVRQKLLKANG
jgi:23S rRNA (guanosine2251-2'-O)-methyltransferase